MSLSAYHKAIAPLAVAASFVAAGAGLAAIGPGTPTRVSLAAGKSLVRCTASIASGPNPETSYNTTYYNPTCYTHDGTAVGTVTTGQYLLVTDVFVVPYIGSGTPKTEHFAFRLGYDLDARNSVGMSFGHYTEDAHSEHFHTPFVIVPGGKRLQVENQGYNYTRSYTLQLTGVLTSDPAED